MNALLRGLSALLILTYPLLVFAGLKYIPLSQLAAGFIVLALLRAMLWQKGSVIPLLLAMVLALVAGYALLSNSSEALLFYPVVVNSVLLAVFTLSLFKGMPMIERLARLREPELPAPAIAYTRQVTKVWCAFFLANGAIAAYTALFCRYDIWAFYNGGVAYGLMAVLFLGEWLVRRKVREKHRVV